MNLDLFTDLRDLKSLTDANLLESADLAVKEERAVLTQVLHYLHEVDRRKLFSALGFKSLHEFAIVRWQYSASQAYRRIAAMKLLRQVPSLEEKINSGAITLCHINVAQSVMQAERRVNKPYSTAQKVELIDRLANTSIRRAEKIALSLVSEPAGITGDRVKTQSNNKIELKFSAHESVQEKIEHLRGLIAHKHPNISLGELFDKLCDLGIKEWTPQTELSKKSTTPNKIQESKKMKAAKNDESSPTVAIREKVATLQKLTHVRTSFLPESIKTAECEKSTNCGLDSELARKPMSYAETIRQMRKRAQHKCENCGSTYALEIEHRIPRAKGGSSRPENMRLFCRACNQRAAIEEFGAEMMEQFILRTEMN